MIPSDGGGRPGARSVAAGLALLVGLALAGGGGYLHLTLAAQVRAGNCDGCEPWHPLLVVAPLVAGSALVLGSGYVLARRR
ncbi:MAG: hypothetical protein ABEH47_02330 [Haloferacaceae archaeon]